MGSFYVTHQSIRENCTAYTWTDALWWCYSVSRKLPLNFFCCVTVAFIMKFICPFTTPHAGLFLQNIASPRYVSLLNRIDLTPYNFLKAKNGDFRLWTIWKRTRQLMAVPKVNFADCFERWKECWDKFVMTR